MIKISHESPLSMLEISRTYNDYDYALVHLFETNPTYYDFFVKSMEQGRKVLLDNSIFELGTAFDTDKYLQWICKLKPSEFIIPDVLEDCDKTIASAQSFIYQWSDLCHSHWKGLEGYDDSYFDYSFGRGAGLIGVVQGKNYVDLVKCYLYMENNSSIRKIAISFDYSYYLKAFPHPNKWVSYMMGRVTTLLQLQRDGILGAKPLHLLGCAHPREFSFYKDTGINIETLDTSSPIVHGLKGVTYSNKIGNWKKEATKLVDLLNVSPDDDQLKTIISNTTQFKDYVNG